MTKRVRFIKDHDHRLNVRETIAYKANRHEATFPNERADELVGLGVAEHAGEGVEGEQQSVDASRQTKRKKNS